jgi:hypothetical protein
VRLLLVMVLGACGRVGFDPLLGTAPGDGGSADATDAPVMATCASYPSAFLCDDFEAGLGEWFEVVDGSNSVVHDTGFSRSGTASAHFLAPDSGSSRLIASVLGGIASGTLHVRFYQWVAASVVIESFSILHLVSDVNPFPGVVLNADTDGMFIQGTIDTTTGPDALTPFPRDSWVCVQATITVAMTNGTVVTFLDGAPSATYTGNTLAPPSGFTDVHIGAFLLQSQPVDTWIDDFVIDVAPIACD